MINISVLAEERAAYSCSCFLTVGFREQSDHSGSNDIDALAFVAGAADHIAELVPARFRLRDESFELFAAKSGEHFDTC